MIRIFILLFLLSNTYSNAQYQYIFDCLTKYSVRNPKVGPKEEAVLYSNSKDSSYYLKVYRKEKQLHATLFDLRNKLQHEYKVLQHVNNDDVFFNFSYLGSREREKVAENFNYTIENNAVGTVLTVRSLKKNSELYTLTMNTAPSETNTFNGFIHSVFCPFVGFDGIKSDEPIFVNTAVLKSKTSVCEFSLQEFKQVSLLLEVPHDRAIK